MATLEEFIKHVQDFSYSEDLTDDELIWNFTLGLAGEKGELIDVFKKYLYHGDALDRHKLILEAGDVCFYVFALFLKLETPVIGFSEPGQFPFSIQQNLLTLDYIGGAISKNIDNFFRDNKGSFWKEKIIEDLECFQMKLTDILRFASIGYSDVFDANIVKLRERHGGQRFDREAQRSFKQKQEIHNV
jgi:NTP pyrophosphatase (non-canonical NTP hydrolase)